MAKRPRRIRWGFSEPSEEDRKRLRATSPTLGTPDYGALTRASRSDMETRRDELKSIGEIVSEKKGSPGNRVVSEIAAAVASHGTAAPGRGQYTGELIRPPKDPEKLGDAKGDLTSSQESAVRKSVREEIQARAEAAHNGIVYTGGTFEEQSDKADSYWAGVRKHLESLTDYQPDKGQPGRKMTAEEVDAKLKEMQADHDEDETHADEKGGKTSAPPSAPPPAEPPPEPVRQPAFDDPAEAAAAIASGADMPYIDLVDAAVAVATPTEADGPDYDPESVFRGVLERRIESDIIGAMRAVRGLERTSADKYHGANARAVMQACGASEREYMLARDLADAGDPAGLLSMQMKFMDSF